MPDLNDDDERISKRVVYEHTSTSGTGRQLGVTIVVIAVIALLIIGYIFMHMHR